MTAMKTDAIFQMPDINSELAENAHRDAVLAMFSGYFSDIDDALRDALPKVVNIFRLLDGPVDLAVHAPNARYLIKQFLLTRATTTTDEDLVDFDMQRVSNCGLCAKTPKGTIRILKNTADGVFKATSGARQRFSSANQLILRFDPTGRPVSLASISSFYGGWMLSTSTRGCKLRFHVMSRTMKL